MAEPVVTGITLAAEYGIEVTEMREVLEVLRAQLGRMPNQREIRRVLDRLAPHVDPGWLAAATAVWAPLLLTESP